MTHTQWAPRIRRGNADHIPRFRIDDNGSALTFSIKPVPPFRLDLTVWTLRRRASNLVDRWDGKTYRRVLMLENYPVEVAVRQSGSINAAQIHIMLTGSRILPNAKALIIQSLERLLGLRINLSEFYRLSATDKNLSPLVKRFRGAKPPRFPTLFEALVNAIACQQMSLSLGIILLSRLAERF
ncbi:MAG: HhH-GPD family protein, partial [Verrucomicrobiales bacterium]|nr:HhH-GPD family protein [Verrucomicrobiales bacterium]